MQIRGPLWLSWVSHCQICDLCVESNIFIIPKSHLDDADFLKYQAKELALVFEIVHKLLK